MSRIGKLPISIPAGVTVSVSDDNVVTVKGKKGELTQTVNPAIKINISDGEITLKSTKLTKRLKRSRNRHSMACIALLFTTW